MTTGYIAVLRAGSSAYRAALLAAGATCVLSWAELAACIEADDAPAVLFDLADLPGGSQDAADLGDLAGGVSAVLGTLASLDPPGGSAAGSVPADRNVVIATVRPIVDTLKLVDAAGVLIGTADRDEHRFVGTPIAARLRVLREVSRELDGTDSIGPAPVAVLTALAGRGATVLASSR